MRENDSAGVARRSWLSMFVAGALAFIGAVLSLGNALAGNDLPAPPLATLGAPFFAVDAVAHRDAATFLAAKQGEIAKGQRELLERQMGVTLPAALEEELPMPSAGRLRKSALAAVAGNALSSIGPTVGSFAATVDGDDAAAAGLIAISQDLSRRDQTANLWLMQSLLMAGRPEAAIDQLDVMLRSLSDPPVQLFQQVVPLLDDAQGRAALSKVVGGNPNWFSPLLEALVAYSQEPGKVADFLLESKVAFPATPRLAPVYASFVDKLVQAGAASQLLAIYPHFPGAEESQLESVSPVAIEGDFPPVTWLVAQDSSRGGAILTSDSGQSNYLELFADPGHPGVVATKVFHAPSARRLTAIAGVEGATGGADARIKVSCVGDDDTTTESANLATGPDRVNLALPAGCLLTQIQVILTPGTERETLKLTLRSLAVS